MPQQRKQMTQTIFSTGFPLSFFSCHKPEVHRGSCQFPLPAQRAGSAVARTPRCQASSSGMGGWFPSPCAPKLLCRAASLSSHQHCFHSNNSTATTLHPAQLIPSTCWPEISKLEHPSGINILPAPKCEHTERGNDSHKVPEQVRASSLSLGNSFLTYSLRSVPERET